MINGVDDGTYKDPVVQFVTLSKGVEPYYESR